MTKIFAALPTCAALGNTARDRNNVTSHLLIEIESLVSGQQTSGRVDFTREQNCPLPNQKIFVTFDRIHAALPWVIIVQATVRMLRMKYGRFDEKHATQLQST